MANGTSGHESEFINVQDLKAALQKFKTDKVDVKVDKVTGKGLSTNDYTTDEKNKLGGIASGATKVTTDTVSGWGYTKNAGTVTGVKMNGTTKSPSSGVVDLGTVITSHQDISGKVNTTTTVNGHALSSNVTVTKSDVGLGSVGNFKAVSTAASQGLTDTEKSNARANIGAGTSSFSGSYNDLSNKPTIPAAAKNGTYTVKTLVGSTTTNVSDFTANQSGTDDVTFVQGTNVTITPDATNRKITIAATDTTYSSKTAASGGTDVSLVTTGEKYTWNNKSNFSGSYNDLTNKPTIPSVSQSTGTSTTAVMSQKAVTDYVQSVMVNPISDSSILVNTEFSPRDVISVDGEMYMADAATSDLPKTNPVIQDNKVVTQDGKVVLGFSSTTSADWHSF